MKDDGKTSGKPRADLALLQAIGRAGGDSFVHVGKSFDYPRPNIP
jgi:hypothetical protein